MANDVKKEDIYEVLGNLPDTTSVTGVNLFRLLAVKFRLPKRQLLLIDLLSKPAYLICYCIVDLNFTTILSLCLFSQLKTVYQG